MSASSVDRWRALYFIHRWIGIAMCLLFVLWFGSGIVMMYVPFPKLTDAEYVSGLEPIDWRSVRIAPTAAIAAAAASAYPRDVRLEMLAGEPVYRITRWTHGEVVISASDGHRMGPFDAALAARSARRFHSSVAVHAVETLERDQWTVAGSYERHRPLHLVSFDDPVRTKLHVSSSTGAPVLDTTARERFWNWLGSVPHWFYFTGLRKDQPLWRQLILWTSGIGVVSAIAGLWIGILRVSLRRGISPYRGWMKWHHVAGLIGGVFVCTWLLSGWLSVNPNRWFDSPGLPSEALQRFAGHLAPDFELESALPLARLAKSTVHARFVWLDSRPLILLTDRERITTVFDARSLHPVRFSAAQVFTAAQRLFPDARLATRSRLQAQDHYWYSHHDERRLPVLRACFADAASTWVHLDPETGEILGTIDRVGRANRWFFDALHSLDFGLLIENRPAWDLVVWSLSIVGLVSSVSGVVIAFRRLTRGSRTRGAASR